MLDSTTLWNYFENWKKMKPWLHMLTRNQSKFEKTERKGRWGDF